MSDTATTVVTSIPAAPVKSAALSSLAEKRKRMHDTLYTDLKVPRWEDPEIFVRFKPISVTLTEAAIDKRRESKVPEWLLLANADILVMACEGVYATLDGDQDTKYSLRSGAEDGPWTKFDADLATALGIPPLGAADVAKALYFTDGDLLNTAAELTNWSNSTIVKVDTDF